MRNQQISSRYRDSISPSRWWVMVVIVVISAYIRNRAPGAPLAHSAVQNQDHQGTYAPAERPPLYRHMRTHGTHQPATLQPEKKTDLQHCLSISRLATTYEGWPPLINKTDCVNMRENSEHRKDHKTTTHQTTRGKIPRS